MRSAMRCTSASTCGEELGLQQHLLQAQPVEGILLDDLDDSRRKELADVAEPARDGGGGGAKSAAPAAGCALAPPARSSRVVEAGEGAVEPLIAVAQAAIFVATERQAPAALPLPGIDHIAHVDCFLPSRPRMVKSSGKAASKPGASCDAVTAG